MSKSENSDPNLVREIINEVLRSPEFRTNIGNVIHQSRLPVSSTPIRNTSLQELRQLFPSVRPSNERNTITNLIKKRRNTSYKNVYSEFFKDVYLVPDPNETKTYSGHAKVDAYKNGYIVSSVKFSKQYDENEVIKTIQDTFICLPPEVKFQFLLPIQGKLVSPTISTGAKFDGQMLSRLYQQKAIYIRTCESINRHNTEHEEEHLSSDDIFDLEMDAAIENSLQDSTEIDNTNQTISVENILTELNSVVSTENINIININRDDVFSSALRGFQRKSFSPYKKMSVSFTDEDGIDNGGPSREMWRLLLSHLQNSTIFEGDDVRKNLSFYSTLYEEKLYFEAGRILAMSLVHGGPGPGYLSETLLKLLIFEDHESIETTIDEVTDLNVKQEITTCMEATTTNELENILENSSFLCVAGFQNIIPDISRKDIIVKGAIKFYVIHRTRPALDQFINGLKTLGILDKIRKYPEIFKPVLCYSYEALTAMKLRNILKIVNSENGCSRKVVENQIVSFWWDYLQDCEENTTEVTTTQILIFITGSDKVPPLGYPIQPTVSFLYDDTSPYPKSNTCTLELKLPVIHKEYKKFQSSMDFGILNGMIFGLV